MKSFRGVPCKCEACNKCVTDVRTGRCMYGGPYDYRETGPWYDELAEKITTQLTNPAAVVPMNYKTNIESYGRDILNALTK